MWKNLRAADLRDMPPRSWTDRIRSRCCREEAQTMAEYVVVLAVITPAVILAFGREDRGRSFHSGDLLIENE